MGFSSVPHWGIVMLIAVVVFSAGKLPRIAGDIAKGIKTFRDEMKDDATSAIVTSNHKVKLG